jgi:hypothetical protein
MKPGKKDNLYQRIKKIVIKRMKVKIKIKNKLEDKPEFSIRGFEKLI